MTFIDLSSSSSSCPSSSTSAPSSHDHMQHLLNIPNFSSLFLSSSTNPPTPRPVTPINDINNNELDFLQQAHAALFLHSPPPAAAAVAAMAAAGEHTSHFAVNAHEYADPYTSTPAMLQLLTALNGPGDHHQQLNLSASADPYAPATLNFFQGRHDASQPTTSATLHHGASLLGATGAVSFEALDHNLLHLGQQQQLPVGEHHQVSGCSSGYLNLFSKDYLGCSFGELNDNCRPPITSATTISAGAGVMSLNPYLQLQPLDIHPPLGSPPTLFQKRAAQRRQAAAPLTPSSSSTSSKLIVPASPGRLNSRAPCSFTTRLLHAADLSFREHMGVQYAEHQKERTVKDSPSPVPQQDLAHVQTANNDDTGDGQLSLLPNSDQDYDLAAEDDENCQALFEMHDPELQRMDAVHGHETMQQLHEKAASCMADDDELLLVQSATDEALQLEAAASEQHISADCTVNRGGRGKVKGPPAKNLMAERRRRKKLNDRLYTLRSVVPKISKMDRASILGDAIEYLKELLQRINDLHNELEASSGPAPMSSTAAITAGLPPAPPTPNSFTNQCSSLTPTSTTSAPGFVKLEEYCPSSASQLHLQCPDPSQPPKIEVRAREGRALNIHMLCGGTRPGLLLASMRALEGLGLDVQQAVISCFNGFALDVFRAQQSEEEEVAAEEVKRVLLHTAGSCYNSSACAVSSSY